jgi:addiction module RelE/StbE family toxin
VIITYTDRFAKDYKKLPEKIKNLAESREDIFQKDPFDPRLKTHKLKGALKKYYSFSITYSYRIVFHFKSDNEIVFDTIGTHEVYK